MSLEACHSPPHLFSLSNELLIDVISNLRPLDIHACQCACRRLNKIIVNSQLIQYILRTALSGVFDPLEPGISLPDRLDALERWVTAWRELDLSKPVASIDALVHRDDVIISEPTVIAIGEQHVITVRTEFGVSAGYSFLDLHTWSSSPNATRWLSIDVQNPNVLSFALSPELGLSVSFSASVLSDHQNIAVTISPMWFNTGGPHPLASRSKLEVNVSRAAVHNLSEVMVIGDYILYWVGAPVFAETHENATLCNIYLVAWKEGWVSELRSSLPGVYGSVLSVLSEEIILLIRLREPALELCRLTNIGDRGKASLETVCIFSLPTLTSRACLRGVDAIEEHPGHALFSKSHQQYLSSYSYPHLATSSGADSSTRIGARSHRLRLRSVPGDGIVYVMMHFNALSGYDRMVDLFVRRRTLLEFSDPQARVGTKGVAGTGVRTVPIIPWETWGPTNSRILDHDSLSWGDLSGERYATVLMSRITMQDFNPYRVRRALAVLGGAGREVTLGCGSMVKVVKEASVYRGGEFFLNDIETNLPYVETVTSYDGCHDFSMDENYLVAEVLTAAGERKLYLHSL